MNPWYERVSTMPQQPYQNPGYAMTPSVFGNSQGPVFQNPLQKAAYIMRALTDPGAFVKQAFPDVPDNISRDPNQVLAYLQRTRGITNEQIQQINNRYPHW